jgi:microcystin-dependent protein
MAEPFIGEIRIFPYSFAPRDWAYCDGQLMDIQQNVMLYTILGLEYGGDGQTTFGLPNFKGRAPMHHGRGTGLYSKWIGERGGYEALPLIESQIPAHTHKVSVTQNAPSSSNPGGLYPAKHSAADSQYKNNPTLDATFASGAMANAGSSHPHENRQPYLVFGFCIALDGLYPARS